MLNGSPPEEKNIIFYPYNFLSNLSTANNQNSTTLTFPERHAQIFQQQSTNFSVRYPWSTLIFLFFFWGGGGGESGGIPKSPQFSIRIFQIHKF